MHSLLWSPPTPSLHQLSELFCGGYNGLCRPIIAGKIDTSTFFSCRDCRCICCNRLLSLLLLLLLPKISYWNCLAEAATGYVVPLIRYRRHCYLLFLFLFLFLLRLRVRICWLRPKWRLKWRRNEEASWRRGGNPDWSKRKWSDSRPNSNTRSKRTSRSPTLGPRELIRRRKTWNRSCTLRRWGVDVEAEEGEKEDMRGEEVEQEEEEEDEEEEKGTS